MERSDDIFTDIENENNKERGSARFLINKDQKETLNFKVDDKFRSQPKATKCRFFKIG